MKISFITASYNYEEYIGETIKSVLAQTISDWEMIVVDDGSKDKSVNLIKKFCKKDSRVRLFRHQGGKNCGLAKTLQLGLEKSSGDWIVFLESDDTIEPNYLEEKIKIINNYPTVKFIFNDVNPVGNQKGFEALNKNTACNYFEKMHERVNRMTFPQRPFKEFKDFNFIPTFSCVMLKKEILDDVSFVSPIPQWLDTYLWSQLVGKYEFFYVDKKLTNWRLHDNSYNNKSLSDEQKHEFLGRSRTPGDTNTACGRPIIPIGTEGVIQRIGTSDRRKAVFFREYCSVRVGAEQLCRPESQPSFNFQIDAGLSGKRFIEHPI